MKVTLAIHHFLPRYSGGAEIYTLRLARWLKARGHQVEVVCIDATHHRGANTIGVTNTLYDGVPVWRLAYDIRRADDAWLWSYANPWLTDWFEAHWRTARPDLVHFHAGYLLGVSPLIAAVQMGLPTVLTLHDYWYLCPRVTLQRGDGSLCREIPTDPAGCAWCQRLTQRRYRLLDQASGGLAGKAAQAFFLEGGRRKVADRRAQLLPALALPQAVLVPSRFLLQQVAPFIAAERVHLCKHGIKPAPLAASRQRTEAEVLRIGYLGQIAPHKGVHVLIEAFRKLRPGQRRLELHL